MKTSRPYAAIELRSSHAALQHRHHSTPSHSQNGARRSVVPSRLLHVLRHSSHRRRPILRRSVSNRALDPQLILRLSAAWSARQCLAAPQTDLRRPTSTPALQRHNTIRSAGPNGTRSTNHPRRSRRISIPLYQVRQDSELWCSHRCRYCRSALLQRSIEVSLSRLDTKSREVQIREVHHAHRETSEIHVAFHSL